MSLDATVRRVLDVIGASAALVLLGPVLALVALAVRIGMGRPVIHASERVGRDGRPFQLLKFRTMRPLRPGERIPDDDDERTTRVGRILRATSLDEVPSFVNVLRGEMALVGPRPLPMRYVPRYSPHQSRRHEVRPGITGWAQVNGRNALSWDEKLELDVWYVDHRSLGLDAKILVRTALDVLHRRGIAHDGHATMPEFDPHGSNDLEETPPS